MIKIGGQFSGVGAFDHALKRLGIDYLNVYQAEWDKYARQTYMLNNEEPLYYVTDVHDTPIEEITDKFGSLDLVMFLPPCQAFSLAGKRLGKADERGILFFQSYEFIKVNQPRFFIFENVKGLLSDDNGNTFNEWINYLGGKSVNGNTVMFPTDEAVPYHIYWKVLNAKDYNIPQNRERVFIVGIREDADNVFSWPREQHLTKRLKDVLHDQVDEKYFLSEKMIQALLREGSIREGQFQPHTENQISKCITARYYKQSSSDPYIKVGTWRTHKDGQGFREIEDGNWPTIPARAREDGSGQPVINDGYKIRRLTPRECFRLMDFDDSFVWNVSDSQAYKQAGNSICVGVLQNIISSIKTFNQ